MEQHAFGAPGTEPKWTHGAKDAVGTAYSTSSHIWFTLFRGVLNEVYYPTIDKPQLRDLQFMIAGPDFLHEEKRHLSSEIEHLAPDTLGFRITMKAPENLYTLTKEIITDPHQPCLLMKITLSAAPNILKQLRLYLIAAPHLDGDGWGDSGYLATVAGRDILTARGDHTWLAIAASRNFIKRSCGYVGYSDGWQDLTKHNELTWQFPKATDGNIALTAEIDLHGSSQESVASSQVPEPAKAGFVARPSPGIHSGEQGTGNGERSDPEPAKAGFVSPRSPDVQVRDIGIHSGDRVAVGEVSFTLGISFGEGLHRATSTLFQSLGTPFEQHKARYLKQWDRASRGLLPLQEISHDNGALFRASHSLILAHEDKSYPGALIAALSIPWGDIKGDEDLGGYHLVWTRDLCHGATALLASGDTDTPLRSLIYLACTQRQDGGFYKNFWIDGRPYSYEVPLDDVAHPILLAWRLKQANALRDFDPYPMVLSAAGYLVRNGPSTPKERWEEISGYSPSTLAVVIAALLCAASFAKDKQDFTTAHYLEGWADFLEAHIEIWTFTHKGELLAGTNSHYVRARAASEDGSLLDLVSITNQAPGVTPHHLASNMIDAGFLELVRYGIRAPNDPRIEASLKVVDHVLKVETPQGPVWRRFPHDGYGQQDNGDPFVTHGRGRSWPLLTAERALYELACGRDVTSYIKALEGLANRAKLLPQQVWDAADIPQRHMYLGKTTGAAMPFLWAHAEYLNLLRSVFDKKVFSVIPFVQARYQIKRTAPLIWKWSYQVNQAPRGTTLRIQAETSFVLHYSNDNWQTKKEITASPSKLGVSFVDLLVDQTYAFIFYWPQSDHWEGKNFSINAQ